MPVRIWYKKESQQCRILPSANWYTCVCSTRKRDRISRGRTERQQAVGKFQKSETKRVLTDCSSEGGWEWSDKLFHLEFTLQIQPITFRVHPMDIDLKFKPCRQRNSWALPFGILLRRYYMRLFLLQSKLLSKQGRAIDIQLIEWWRIILSSYGRSFLCLLLYSSKGRSLCIQIE